MTTTTNTPTQGFKPLGELYLRALIDDAYHESAAGTIRDAITTAAGCGGAPDGPDLMRAACQLTRSAMGYLEAGMGQISRDELEEWVDWARIDAFWDSCTNKAEHPDGGYVADGTEAEVEAAQAEAIWVHEQLDNQSERVSLLYRDYANPEGSQNHGGIHWEWIHQIEQAATFLQAAALLLADAFGIEGDSADG